MHSPVAIITFKEGRYKDRRLEVHKTYSGSCWSLDSAERCVLHPEAGCMKATHKLCMAGLYFKDAHDPE